MTLLENDWDKIRAQFNKNEEHTIMLSRCGQTIVPRAWIINVDLVPQDILVKLKLALKEINAKTDHFNPTGNSEADATPPAQDVTPAGEAPQEHQGPVRPSGRRKV